MPTFFEKAELFTAQSIATDISSHLKEKVLETYPRLPQRLSISHTQDIGVLLALPDGIDPHIAKIGVDIELATRRPPSPAVIRRMFSPQEQAWIADGQLSALEAWCVKEALWKSWTANHQGPLPHVQMTHASPLLKNDVSLRGVFYPSAGSRKNGRGNLYREKQPCHQGHAALGRSTPQHAEWGVEHVILHDVALILAWATSLDHAPSPEGGGFGRGDIAEPKIF